MRYGLVIGALALVAAVACGDAVSPTDSGTTRMSYAEAVSRLCGGLRANDDNDPRVAVERLGRFRDDVAKLSPPAADRATVRERFLGPLNRMVSANREAADLTAKTPPSQGELDAAQAKLDEADQAFVTMQSFFRDFDIVGCDR